jgi:hypothetical protein
MFRPVIVPEIRVGGPGRDHQVIVSNRPRTGVHATRVDIDASHLLHPHGDVALPAHDVPQRRGDIGAGQRRTGHLVQQRLEHVMVGAIDQRHAHRRVRQGAHGFQATEAAAENHHVGLSHGITHGGHRRCGHVTSP